MSAMSGHGSSIDLTLRENWVSMTLQLRSYQRLPNIYLLYMHMYLVKSRVNRLMKVYSMKANCISFM